jgi:hypothetical protein
VRILQRLEEQVVDDEAQVGLARAVVDQRDAAFDASTSLSSGSMNWYR